MPRTMSSNESIRVIAVPGHGTEDVLVGDDGTVYTGTEDGEIWAVQPDGSRIQRVAGTGGRPLGLEWLADGRMLVCDARRGLLAVDVAEGGSGEVEVLVPDVAGVPMLFCNNAAVHSNGDIYFSDSSQKYGIEAWKADAVEDTRTGRLLRRNAADGSVEVLLEGLRFANGVTLSADESFVAVAEASGRTVVRLWLTGDRAGSTDLLVDDLPGYPDNIALGTDGLIWVTICTPRNALLEDVLSRAPKAVRRLVTKLPEAVQPKPHRTVRIMALDDAGEVVHDRDFDAAHFHFATGVREHHGTVWVGSLEEPAIASFAVR